MNTRLLIIAHAPLAHALRECALHVFPDCWQEVLALDVPPHEAPEATLSAARALMEHDLHAGLRDEDLRINRPSRPEWPDFVRADWRAAAVA